MKEYQLAPSEVEKLKEWDYETEEIRHSKCYLFSFEDWLNSETKFSNTDRGMIADYRRENGDIVTKEEGVLTVYILHEDEFLKIRHYQKETLERFVDEYKQALIEYFEARLSNAINEKFFIETELQRVENLLTDRTSKDTYLIHSDMLWLSFSNERKDYETIWYWYNQPVNVGMFIYPRHIQMTAKDLKDSDKEKFIAAAQAFQQFKEFLNQKLEAHKAIAPSKSSTAKRKKKEQKSEGPLPDLQNALVDPQRLPSLFKWLTSKQGERVWFDKNGYIGSDERNASILLGFSYGMRMARQIKPTITDKKFYHVLCQHYSVTPTPEPHKSKNRHNYDDVKGWVMEFFGVE
ncbi:MAG TPA: hypothetical protein PL134_09570 [Smithellaceae bacterium]|nr:hypothetical protein [Smithellaceae bacterium]